MSEGDHMEGRGNEDNIKVYLTEIVRKGMD